MSPPLIFRSTGQPDPSGGQTGVALDQARVGVESTRKPTPDVVVVFETRPTPELLVTDFLVILNHRQVTRTTPELALPLPNFHTTNQRKRMLELRQMQRKHRPPPTWRVFLSRTKLELMIRRPRVRFLTIRVGDVRPKRKQKDKKLISMF
ncbi:hypothetical protein TNCV_238041 [Trichonephila clavipes]|nr:hypothetical protein TNCV_238041 [Trichonephila clavipes]